MLIKRNFLELSIYIGIAIVWYIAQYLSWNGDYLDTDNYFHAIRLVDMLNNGYWFEHAFMLTNYPYGEILHWTRALDVIWIIFSLPFLAVYNVRLAVFYSGMLVAPFFFVLAVVYLVKSARLLMNWKYRLLTALLIVVQANVLRVVLLNRPDHHAAFVFLSAFVFYKLLKFLYKNKSSDLTWAALMAAVSLWMAAEGVFLFVGGAVFLFYGFLFLDLKYASLQKFFFVYTLAASLFFVINPPFEGYLFMDSGRLSLFYILALWGATGGVFLGSKLHQKSHIVLLLLTGVLIIAGLYYLCGFLVSPLDERVIQPFVARITEMQSGNIYTLSYPVVALLSGLFLFVKRKLDKGELLLFFYLFLFTCLTVYSRHFLPYAGVFAAFMMALLVSKISYKIFFGSLFLLLEFLSFTIHALTTDVKNAAPISVPAEKFMHLKPGCFASDIFVAPYLIWFGGHPVIASPYHRNVEGILDNHQIFFSRDEKEVIDLIKKHQVRYIYLPYDADPGYYVLPKEHCQQLYGKILGCHNYPRWLRVLEDKKYYLFEVKTDNI